MYPRVLFPARSVPKALSQSGRWLAMEEPALLAHGGLRCPFGVRTQPKCQHRKSPVSNPIAISADGDAKCRCARVIMLVDSRVGLGVGLGANRLRGPRFLCFLRLLALVCCASPCTGPPSTWSSFSASFPSPLPLSLSSHVDAGSTAVSIHPCTLGGTSPW